MLIKWFKQKDKYRASSRNDEDARPLPLRQIPGNVIDDAIRRLPAKADAADARVTTSAHVQGKGLVQLEFAWQAKSVDKTAGWQLVDARQARQDLFTSKAEFPAHVRQRLD